MVDPVVSRIQDVDALRVVRQRQAAHAGEDQRRIATRGEDGESIAGSCHDDFGEEIMHGLVVRPALRQPGDRDEQPQ